MAGFLFLFFTNFDLGFIIFLLIDSYESGYDGKTCEQADEATYNIGEPDGNPDST